MVQNLGMFLLAGIVSFLGGCAAPRPVVLPPTREALIEREAVAESVLLKRVQERIGNQVPPGHAAARATREVEIFLRKLGVRLAGSDPEVGHRPLGVIVTRSVELSVRPFGIPGNRVYVPLALLKVLKTENEWAACIAFELAHLIRHSLAYRWDSGELSADLFGPGGLFAFDDRDHRDAAARAVRLLYDAGYDARGVTAYFAEIRKITEHNPWSEDTIDLLEDAARRTAARLAPLRRPVVRSPEFLAVQTWMEKL